MACRSPDCPSAECEDALRCIGHRLIALEHRAQNVSTRQAEERSALDALAEQLEHTKADFTAALIAFRRQLAPMNVPIVRKKA